MPTAPVAPRLRGDPRDDLEAVELLLLGVLVRRRCRPSCRCRGCRRARRRSRGRRTSPSAGGRPPACRRSGGTAGTRASRARGPAPSGSHSRAASRVPSASGIHSVSTTRTGVREVVAHARRPSREARRSGLTGALRAESGDATPARLPCSWRGAARSGERRHGRARTCCTVVDAGARRRDRRARAVDLAEVEKRLASGEHFWLDVGQPEGDDLAGLAEARAAPAGARRPRCLGQRPKADDYTGHDADRSCSGRRTTRTAWSRCDAGVSGSAGSPTVAHRSRARRSSACASARCAAARSPSDRPCC